MLLDKLFYSGDLIIYSFIVGLFAANALILLWLTSRPWAKIYLESYIGVSNGLYRSVMTVFAFTAAFLGASVWGSFNINANSVNVERQAISILAETVSGTPTLNDEGIQSLLRNYVHSAIEDEWPILVNEQISQKTQVAFNQLRVRIIEVATNTKSSLVANMLIRAFEALDNARQVRINHRWHSIEPVRWYILFGVALLAQFAVVANHLDVARRPMALSLFIITTLIIIVVGLIAMSVNHYEGVVVISPEPFRKMLESL